MTANEAPQRNDPSARAAWLALPWRVNGTLEAPEARDVEAQLATSPEFRAEERLLQRMQSEVRDAPMLEEAMVQGFTRLRAQVEATAPVDGPPSGSGSMGERWWRALEDTPARMRAILGIQAVAIACSVALLIGVPTSAPETPTFTMLADTVASPDGPHWRVRLAPDVAELAFREVLLANGLNVVAGPTATGVYTLGPTAASAAAADVTARLLQAPPIAFAVHVP